MDYNKFPKAALRTLLMTLIPGLLLYASRSDLIETMTTKIAYLQSIPVNPWKDFCFVIGTLLSAGGLSLLATYHEIKAGKHQEQRNAMAKVSNKFFLNVIEAEFQHVGVRVLQIEAFVPYTDIWTPPKCLIKALSFNFIRFNKYFVTIAGYGTNQDLCFRVTGLPQGVVGRCYQERGSVIKCKTDDLHLNRFQEYLTQDWKFWLCVPIFNDKDEICLILSLNSNVEPQLSNQNAEELSKKLVSYGVDIAKHLMKLSSEKNAMRL